MSSPIPGETEPYVPPRNNLNFDQMVKLVKKLAGDRREILADLTPREVLAHRYSGQLGFSVSKSNVRTGLRLARVDYRARTMSAAEEALVNPPAPVPAGLGLTAPPAVEPSRVPSVMDLLIAQAGLIAELEERLAQLERDVSELKEIRGRSCTG